MHKKEIPLEKFPEVFFHKQQKMKFLKQELLIHLMIIFMKICAKNMGKMVLFLMKKLKLELSLVEQQQEQHLNIETGDTNVPKRGRPTIITP